MSLQIAGRGPVNYEVFGIDSTDGAYAECQHGRKISRTEMHRSVDAFL